MRQDEGLCLARVVALAPLASCRLLLPLRFLLPIRHFRWVEQRFQSFAEFCVSLGGITHPAQSCGGTVSLDIKCERERQSDQLVVLIAHLVDLAKDVVEVVNAKRPEAPYPRCIPGLRDPALSVFAAFRISARPDVIP